MVSMLAEEILDVSRQNSMGALAPWFEAALVHHIHDGEFPAPHQLDGLRLSLVDRWPAIASRQSCTPPFLA